ncbi:hypothetical protein E0493_19990 [Roseomonas sp. M0104]|uniref:Uncharacterized protein n=1 Tax=Teichococcus coralli TaxID=2545983 RepID=A0A845BHU1_9PROT|nr:hypothetical protein [Pseudoroseomonas coralli]MXP65634.1 hypothetical protein [Pseudoroseomonas coralli]
MAVLIGEKSGRAVRLTGSADAVLLGRTGKLRVAAFATGRLQLEIGATILRAAALRDGDTQAAFGLTTTGDREAHVQLRLGDKPQRIEAPGGIGLIIEKTPDGPPDLQVEAGRGVIRTFNVSAILRHCAIRLPLEKTRNGSVPQAYADLGRLDFWPTRLVFGLGAPKADGAISLVELGQGGTPPISLSLDDARLTVRRERDLLSLVFGFQHVTLVAGSGAPVLRLLPPETETLVAARPGRPPLDVRAAGTVARQPLLRVEFPPQHVLEHAFARRRPPIPTPDKSLDEDKRRDRARDTAQRATVFDEIKGPDGATFASFVQRYRDILKTYLPGITDAHPDHFWFDEDLAFTPQARQAARDATMAMERDPTPPLHRIPLGLGRIIVTDLIAAHPFPESGTEEDKRAWALALLQNLLLEAERRDDDHSIIQRAWRATQALGPRQFYDKGAWGTAQPGEPVAPWEGEFNDPGIITALREMWKLVPDFAPASAKGAVEQALRVAYTEPFPWAAGGCVDPTHWGRPVEARAAGVTHLVFEWGHTKSKPAARDELPYALSTLLEWKSLPLRVSRRAERFEPKTPGELRDALGRQGIRPGTNAQERLRQVVEASKTDHDLKDDAARREEEARIALRRQAAEAAKTERERNDETARLEDEARFAFRTRIALPARLHLSPAGDARFHPAPDPPSSPSDPAPLWRAELRETEGRMHTLRALGSPDFVPEALGLGENLPLRGTGNSWINPPVGSGQDPVTWFRGALDAFDRHQIVGLSGVHGLPVLPRRGPDGKLHVSQLAPPDGYALVDIADGKDQALYVPQTLPTRLMTLSAMGGTLDLDARFTPPAALRRPDSTNLFAAFAVERWRSRIVLGRDVVTEVLYKGFLYPLGHRATLVKVTERRFEPAPPGVCGGPVAFLTQRLFIQVASPIKTYGAIAQPFAGRGWPATSVEIMTRQTPDLIEPFLPRRIVTEPKFQEQLRGTLLRKDGVGLIFWPRTAPGRENDVRFRLRVDGAADVVDLPLLFVDNQAAHEPDEMRWLQDYYTSTVKVDDTRRRLQHHGAKRRYAPERQPGDTSYETREWLLRADSREELPEHDRPVILPSNAEEEVRTRPSFSMDSTLESDDQPPFYPRLQQAYIRPGPASRFSGRDIGELTVTYTHRYLQQGLRPTEDDARKGDGVDQDTFLRVLAPDDAKLEFGDGGDRGGAVGRPEQPIRGLARIGPVGGTAKQASFGLSPDFFADDAKLLGLLTFKELLNGVQGAAAPLLKEVVEFTSDPTIIKIVEELGAALDGLHRPFEHNPVLAEVYPEFAKALRHARDDVRGIVNDPDAAVTLYPAAVASLRTLAEEVERVASAPLAPLAQFSRRELEKLREGLTDRLRTLGQNLLALPELMQAVQDAVRAAEGFIQPVNEAWLIARYVGAEVERALLNGVALRIGQALTEAFQTVASRRLPDTLAEFRAAVATEASTRLMALAEQQGGPVEVVLGKLADQAPASIRNAHLPEAFVDLYAAGVAASRFNLAAVAHALTARAITVLRPWAEGGAADLCEKATAALDPLRPILVRGELAGLIPCGPQPDANACAVPGGAGWCARLWVAICDLGGEVPARTNDLLNGLAELDGAGRALLATAPLPGPSCDARAAVREWQRLTSAWAAVAGAAERWLDTLTTRARALIAAGDTALTNRIRARLDELAAIARELLQVLAPPKTLLAPAQRALEAALGEDAAKEVIVPLEQALDQLDAALVALPASPADAAAALGAAGKEFKKLPASLKGITETLLGRLFLARIAPMAKDVLDHAARRMLGGVAEAYGPFIDARDTAADELTLFEARLGYTGPPRLACAVFIGLAPGQACARGTTDEVVAERARWTAAAASASPNPAVTALRLLQDWQERKTAPQQLLDAILSNLAAAVAAQLVQMLDLGDIRQKIEDVVAQLVPTSISRTYDYKLPLRTRYPLGPIVFKPYAPPPPGAPPGTPEAPALTLSAKARISVSHNLQQDSLPPPNVQLGIRATLSSFDLVVLEMLTLKFKEFTFTAGTGQSSRFDAPFDRVVLDGPLVFLAALAAYLGYKNGGGGAGQSKPNGPYVEPRPTGAGLRAGFRLAIPGFNIGTLGFANVSFNGHFELPFDKGEGIARLALSSRRAPFVISCAPYGGAGFVYAEADAKGTRRLDISLEFGGAATINFGPLEGVGRIMAGLYLTQGNRDEPIRLFGTFTAAFVGTVAGFGVTSGFYLRMFYDSGQMAGEATLSYSFSIGIADIKISFPVWRSEGGHLGGGSGEPPARVTTTSAANGVPSVIPVALTAPVAAVASVPAGIGRTNVPSPLEDWSAHRRLYDTGLRLPPRRVDS